MCGLMDHALCALHLGSRRMDLALLPPSFFSPPAGSCHAEPNELQLNGRAKKEKKREDVGGDANLQPRVSRHSDRKEREEKKKKREKKPHSVNTDFFITVF